MKKCRFFIITILLTFGISGFIYFINKSFISDYHLIGFAIDNKIPMINEFIYFYAIWYPFEIGVLYYIYKLNKKTYTKTFIALFISLLIAHICFFIYPTTINRPEFNTYTGLTSWLIYFTYTADIPVNCFPSIHCLICYIVIYATIDTKEMKKSNKIIIYIINILIILSTLFVKQHVIIDVIGSVIITIIVYYFICHLKIIKDLQNKINQYD